MKINFGSVIVGILTNIISFIYLYTFTDLSDDMCKAFSLTNTLICSVVYSISYKLDNKNENGDS